MVRAHLREIRVFENIFAPRKSIKFASLVDAVDESINLEHGDIVVLAVFECWEASTLFSKIDITVS